MAKEKKSGGGKRKLLDAVRKHQDALQAGGLSPALVDKYENALRVIDSQGKEPGAAEQVLVKDLQREVGEIQAAVKKEFPGNASFQSIFKANQPMPQSAREVLVLGRLVAKEAPEFAQNLIKYAINAATVNHLKSLCDQLEKEIGGSDPVAEARALEEQILEIAKRTFEGKPELAAFEK
ncbi:MAG: hypothetical protein ACXWLM_01810 [Myxococcales bacterium]